MATDVQPDTASPVAPEYDPLAKYGALLSYTDACEAVALHRRTIERMVSAGEFPRPISPANLRSVRFRAVDIARWLANGCMGRGRRRK